MRKQPGPGPRVIAGNAVFYPLAAAYALFAAPASVLSMSGAVDALPALATPIAHAHEMLFGFALAAVAGNQLGPLPAPRLALVAGLWLLARAAFLFAPQSVVAAAANVAFAALLALHIVPRLLAGAKKPRNKALPAALLGICGSAIAYHVAARAGSGGTAHTLLTIAVLLFALLMLFMGGRLLAPAIAGQLYRQGGNLEARVQPWIEGALILSLLLAAAATAFASEPAFGALAAGALTLAGGLTAARMWRWRLWTVRGRPDIFCLAAGYAWLAAGLVAAGVALATGGHLVTALHVMTVGSLGTLTLNVMAMTWLLKARKDPAGGRLPVWATCLIAAATLARIAADSGFADRQSLLFAAALCWSAAFGLLLALFARTRARAPQP